MTIRRILWMLLPVLLLCGCSAVWGGRKPESLQLTMDAPAEIRWSGKTCQCRIVHDLTQKTEILFEDSGGVLQGLCFRREAGTSSFQYGDLHHSILPGSLPDENPAERIARALDAAQAVENLKEDGGFSGYLQDGTPFSIGSDPDGTITNLSVGSDTEVYFP